MASSRAGSSSPSFAWAVLRHARLNGSERALSDRSCSLTFGELAGVVEALAAQLALRLAPGPLAIAMRMDAAAAALLLAADLARIPSVLLPATLPEGERQMAMRASGAHSIALPEESILADPRALQLVEPGFQPVAVGSETGSHGEDGPSWWQDREVLSCQLTSGSMGLSRLAARTREGVGLEIRSVSAALALTARDLVLCGSSIAHSYGWMGGVLTPLAAGIPVVLASGAEELHDALRRHHPTIVFGLGPTFRELLRTEPVAGPLFTSVRFAFSAGAPLPSGLFDAYLSRYGMVIRQDYGATEVGTISLDTRGEPDPRSVGVPLPHMEVEMRPERRDRGPEAYREVLVRSPATAAGYVDGGRLVPCVDRDGWYHTGDAGEWKGSALTLGGRLREQVVVDGRPIDLDRVEAVIRTCPGVEDVVVTTEGEGGSTTLVATVVAPSADGVELERWCARALPPHEAPARIVLRRELPRSPAGKVLGKYLP